MSDAFHIPGELPSTCVEQPAIDDPTLDQIKALLAEHWGKGTFWANDQLVAALVNRIDELQGYRLGARVRLN